MKTGITDTHTLADMFADIKDGSFIGYLKATDGTLAECLSKLRLDVDKIAETVGISL